MAAASDRGSASLPGVRGSKSEPLAQQRAQVQRVPAGALVQPLDGLVVQRSRRERGGQRRDLIRVQPAQWYAQPVLDAQQHPLCRLVQTVAGPAVGHHGGTGSTDSRRSVNVSASTDLRSAHCRSSITMATAPRVSPTTSSKRAPAANDETGSPVPPPARPRMGRPRPPSATGRRFRGPGRSRPRRPGPTAPSGRGLGQAAPHQGCLPDAGITLDGHQPWFSRLDAGDDLRDPRDLRRPADENVERHLPVRHPATSLPPVASATQTIRA